MNEQKKSLLKRTLQMVLPMVLLLGIIIGSTQIKRTQIVPDTNSSYVKATVTEVLEDHANGQAFAGPQTVLAKITSGTYKGHICELDNANTYHEGAMCSPGTKIIALITIDAEGNLKGLVYNHDRTSMIYLLLALFALILILVGGKKGAAALYALIFTFVCILCVYIPLLYLGVNGILTAILTAILILVTSIYILNGWSTKTLCAIIGTTVGVAISGLLAMVIGKAFHLSGYNMEDVESMMYIADHTKLDVKNILYAGVLISSLGAVMDVSVSVVAAMQEVLEKAPHLSAKELFRSGMRVGHDMMGTMSNTLILAYAGSATSILLYVYSYEMTYTKTMGYNGIVIEILCGLCGTIGVILTVPLQAAVAVWILKSKSNTNS